MSERLTGIIPELIRGRLAPKDRVIYRARPTMSRRARIASRMLASYDETREEERHDH